MLFYLRTLSPVPVDELTAAVAIEALEWHQGHLTNQSREARDRADRPAWALTQLQLHAAGDLRRRLRDELEELGPMPEDTAEYHRGLLRRRGLKLPQSAANAHILRAERAVRIEAEKARKAAYWERVEAGRRMAGGKWSRPKVTDTPSADGREQKDDLGSGQIK